MQNNTRIIFFKTVFSQLIRLRYSHTNRLCVLDGSPARVEKAVYDGVWRGLVVWCGVRCCGAEQDTPIQYGALQHLWIHVMIRRLLQAAYEPITPFAAWRTSHMSQCPLQELDNLYAHLSHMWLVVHVVTAVTRHVSETANLLLNTLILMNCLHAAVAQYRVV